MDIYNILNCENLLIISTSIALLFLTLYQKYEYRYEKLLTQYNYLIKK